MPSNSVSPLLLRKRIRAAVALHQHEPDGNWIVCDGHEYSASKGCPTLRALHGRVTGGSTETADKQSADNAHTDGPKPYLCGCPSDDPRPCPLHDRDSDDPAQAGER